MDRPRDGEPAALPLLHLNLTVGSVEASIAFYRRWFGFRSAPQRYPDGTVFVRNDQGFDLAFHPGAPAAPPAPAVHFGFRATVRSAVRGLREGLRQAGVAIVEEYDEEGYVNVKCSDPDGYVIEVYWEPV